MSAAKNLRCPNPACKGHNKGGYVKPATPDGVWCNADCQCRWSAKDCKGWEVLGRAPDWSRREDWEAVRAAGVDLPDRGAKVTRADLAPPPAPEEPEWWLTPDRARELWQHTRSSASSAVTEPDRAYLREAMGCVGHEAVRVIPEGEELPPWAAEKLGAWTRRGYRTLYMLVHPSDGVPRAVKLRWTRPVDGADPPKEARLSGVPLKGLVCADRVAMSVMRGERAASECRALVVLEGPKDFGAGAARWAPHHPDVAHIGLISGSVTPDLVKAWATVPRVVVLTDPDGGGDRYAHHLAEVWKETTGADLPGIRVNPVAWATRAYDVAKPPDVADLCRMGDAPQRLDLLLAEASAAAPPTPDEIYDGVVAETLNACDLYRRLGDSTALGVLRSANNDSDGLILLASEIPAVIARLRTPSGAASWRVAWRSGRSGLRTVEVSAGASASQIADLLGAAGLTRMPGAREREALGAWVGLTAHWGAALSPAVLVLQSLGWHGRAFVVGRDTVVGDLEERVEISTTGMADEVARVIDAAGPVPGGDASAWLRGMAPLLGYPVPGVALLWFLAAPLLVRTGQSEGSVLLLAGDPGSAKTTAAQIASSAGFRPERDAGYFTTWAGSLVGMEQRAQVCRHVGVLLDDTAQLQADTAKPEAQAQALARRVYQLAGGTVRDVMRGGRSCETWAALHLATGETPPDLRAAADGAAKRLVVLDAPAWATYQGGGEITVELRAILTGLWDAACAHAGTLLPEVLREYLRHSDAALRSSWMALSATWADRLTAAGVPYAMQRGQLLALLAMAQRALKQVTIALGTPCPVSERAVEWLADHLAITSGGAPVGALQRAWPSFLDWLRSQRRAGGPLDLQDAYGRWVPVPATAGPRLGVWRVAEARRAPTYESEQEASGLDLGGAPGDLFITEALVDLWLRTQHGPLTTEKMIQYLVRVGVIEPNPKGRSSTVKGLRWKFHYASRSADWGWKVPAGAFADLGTDE